MKTQIKNLALVNSRFVFDRVLFLDISYHQLKLTRGSSYLPLQDWIANKKAVINPKNEADKECFKWAILTAFYHESIDSHWEQISKFRRFKGNYEWGGYPVALNEIGVFERKNDVSVNVLGIEGGEKMLCILRKSRFDGKKMINLLLIDKEWKRHYAAIKNLSRPLMSSNSKHQHQQHFCLNCLHGFHSEASRDKHFEYCIPQ